MYYGNYGGQYVTKELKGVLKEIEENYNSYYKSEEFKKEYLYYLKNYVGRPSPIYYAKNLTNYFGGAKIYLKREDLNHTGAHKINNAIGQILLAKHMGKSHIIAETGAGQHGVATATVCALFGMKCSVFMGEEDMKKQAPNVYRMKMLGAQVIPVTIGTKTLKEAVDVAINYLVENKETVYYLIGSAVGPHPYPEMVKCFQKIIGEEVRTQILEEEGKLPKAIIACVGGGSNAIGIFNEFIKEDKVDLIGIEAAGLGIDTKMHASAFIGEKIGTLHGMKTYVLQDEKGELLPAYSISSGLDYPGVGPMHAYLHETNRVKYDTITDKEAIKAFHLLCEKEGIIPALESSHAIAYLEKIAKNYKKEDIIIVNLSGRGDKDIETIIELEK